jgi:hypothetical protein
MSTVFHMPIRFYGSGFLFSAFILGFSCAFG